MPTLFPNQTKESTQTWFWTEEWFEPTPIKRPQRSQPRPELRVTYLSYLLSNNFFPKTDSRTINNPPEFFNFALCRKIWSKTCQKINGGSILLNKSDQNSPHHRVEKCSGINVVSLGNAAMIIFLGLYICNHHKNYNGIVV